MCRAAGTYPPTPLFVGTYCLSLYPCNYIYFVRSLSPPFDTNNWPYTTYVTVKKTTFNPYLVSKQKIAVCWPSRESCKQTNQTYIRCIIPCWTTYTNEVKNGAYTHNHSWHNVQVVFERKRIFPWCAILRDNSRASSTICTHVTMRRFCAQPSALVVQLYVSGQLTRIAGKRV